MLWEGEGTGAEIVASSLGPPLCPPPASFHRDSSAVMRQISYIHRNARLYFPSFGVGRLLRVGSIHSDAASLFSIFKPLLWVTSSLNSL